MRETGRLAELRAPLAYRDFRRVWLAQIASELGDWAARLALALLVLERTDSPALSAFSFTVSVLPTMVLGPWLSAVGDRYPRRRVLVVADLARGAIYATMALPLPTWTLFPLLFVAATATPPFEAIRSALLPDVVPDHVYGSAVVLSGITGQAALLGGYTFGGGLVGLVGARPALLVNGMTFVVSALLLVGLRSGGACASGPESAVSNLRRGLGVLLADDFVRRTSVFVCAVSAGAIVGEALAPAYARDVLDRGAGVAGILSAAVPVGTIGLSVVGRSTSRDATGLRRFAGYTCLTAGAGAAAFASGSRLAPAIVGFLAVGGVFGWALRAASLLGLALPEDVRASAFGLLQAALIGAQGIGAAVGGLIAQYGGVRPTSAAALVAVVLLALPAMRGTRSATS